MIEMINTMGRNEFSIISNNEQYRGIIEATEALGKYISIIFKT